MKVLCQIGRTEHAFTEIGENDEVVHIGAGDVDGPLGVVEDDIGVKAYSAYRFRRHDADNPDGEAVEIIDLVGLEEQVLFGIQHVRGEGDRLLGSFDPELDLNRLRQICIIAQLIDDPCCGKGRFGGNLSDIAGVEQQPVVGNLTTGLQGGGELGDSDSAVLSIDIALHVIGVNDEKIEHFISISVLNDWTDSIGIDDLLHYGGSDYHRSRFNSHWLNRLNNHRHLYNRRGFRCWDCWWWCRSRDGLNHCWRNWLNSRCRTACE